MVRTIMLIPATVDAGTTVVAYGFADALNTRSVRAAVFPAFDIEKVEALLSEDRLEVLLEDIVGQHITCALNKDVVLIVGVSLDRPYAAELNFAIATALDSAVIFVTSAAEGSKNAEEYLRIIATPYLCRYEREIIGYVINKSQDIEKYSNFLNIKFPLLGKVPYRNELSERVGSFHAEISGSIVSKHLEVNWLWPFLNKTPEPKLTPPMFRYNLIALARKANKRIVLPEADEPRTLQAANICVERGIARCVLLGNKNAIHQAATKINLKLDDRIEIIEPQGVVEKYVEPLVAARRGKGLTTEAARKQLEDNVVLGTMMLQLGEVDGLVSGAVHTTANTIRPALQIIKTVPGAKLVSSAFFICLADQVLVYGDCAINPNPIAEELADIAIQSADSAVAFGIPARVAMLSYSTGTSGFGPDVDRVKDATAIVRQKRPDLEVDGPMQYDAAIDKTVAKLKAPESRVAGKATVFIVPELNVGNIVYKAVQRSTNVVCIGPMLQGLNKPVNDLSRGCLVEDIIFTIAITAVQSIKG